MNPLVKEITVPGKAVCQYCNKSDVNSLEWGPLYQLAGVTVHYFCMLFSAGLSQNGEDEQGILGFMPFDINKELKRGDKLKCKYCKQPRATIGCSVKSCKSSYHYPCGLEKSCVFHFIGNYESYCLQHREKVDIPLPKDEWDCPICLCEVDEGDALWPPCCKKKVFHKRCIMESARNAGAHFFKCPLCNDKDIFSVAMRKNGVYLPDRDATWEMNNAFEEQTRQYTHCDEEVCLCPKGRDYTSKSESKPWKIVRCGACGATAVHKKCGKLQNLSFRCNICARILSDKRKLNESINSSRIQRHQFDLASDDELDDENVMGIKEVIITPPEIDNQDDAIIDNDDIDNVSMIGSSNGSSSEDEGKQVVIDSRYNRPVILDRSDSEESEGESPGGEKNKKRSNSSSSDGSDTDSDNDLFINVNEKRLRQRLKMVRVSTEIKADAGRVTDGLRNALKAKNGGVRPGNLFYAREQGNIKKIVVNQSEPISKENYEQSSSSRVSNFNSKLNETLVQCLRQSSSHSAVTNATDNVSNPAVSPIDFPTALSRDNLIKVDTRRSVNNASVSVDIQVQHIISENEVMISSENSNSGSSSFKQSLDKANVTPKIFPVDDDDDDDCIEIENSTQSDDGNSNQNKKGGSECITVEDDDSDLEIVSENVKPSAKTTAFLEMVQARRHRLVTNSALVRLGFDDHENDDIELVTKVCQDKPTIDCSPSLFSKPATSFSVSSAFLRVIENARNNVPSTSNKASYAKAVSGGAGGSGTTAKEKRTKSNSRAADDSVVTLSDDDDDNVADDDDDDDVSIISSPAPSSTNSNQGSAPAASTKKFPSKRRLKLNSSGNSSSSSSSKSTSKRQRK